MQWTREECVAGDPFQTGATSVDPQLPRRGLPGFVVHLGNLASGCYAEPVPKSFDFEVSLAGARPKVWRRFLLSTGATFFDLHEAIQRACGWWNYHLFSFRAVPVGINIAGIPDEDGFNDEAPVPDAKDVRLADYFTDGRKRAEYEYDFGDGWIHDVKMLAVVEEPERQKRKLLGGARAFPHEDCGGIDGYRRCATFVKTGKDPFGEGDDKGLRTWLGGWHPDHFDLEATRKKFDSRQPSKAVVVVTESAKHERPVRGENAWCTSLGIEIPDVSEVAKRRTAFGPARLGDLVVVELLAHGGPMTDAEVVQSLSAAGLSTGTGDLAKSLKKSLAASQAPLLRDHVGRLTVDLNSRGLNSLVRSLRLRGPPPERPAPKTVATADGPLTCDEVDAAYDKRISWGDTMARFLSAALDAERAPMKLDDAIARYVSYGGSASRFDIKGVLHLLSKRGDMIVDGDVIRLTDDADLRAMRLATRKRAKRVLEAREHAADRAAAAVTHKEWQREQRRAAACARRVVIASTPSMGAPRRIEAFDFAAREALVFEGDGLHTFATWITTFDVVTGVRPHQTLSAFGVDFNRFTKIVDLLPAKKTSTVDGRQFPITWEAIVEGTLGSSALPSSLATLVALYRYALLHELLWMRYGPVRSDLLAVDVDAALRGEQDAYYALKEAMDTGAAIALWIGVPQEVLSAKVVPLKAIVRGQVLDMRRGGEIVMRDERGRTRTIYRAEIHGMDVTGGTDFAWRLPVTSLP